MITISARGADNDPTLVMRTGDFVPFGVEGIRALRRGQAVQLFVRTQEPSRRPDRATYTIRHSVPYKTHERRVVDVEPGRTAEHVEAAETAMHGLSRAVDYILGYRQLAGQGESLPGIARQAAELIVRGRPVVARAYGVTMVLDPTVAVPSYYRDPFGPAIQLGAARRPQPQARARHRSAPGRGMTRHGRRPSPVVRRRRGRPAPPRHRPGPIRTIPSTGPIPQRAGGAVTPPTTPPAPPPPPTVAPAPTPGAPLPGALPFVRAMAQRFALPVGPTAVPTPGGPSAGSPGCPPGWSWNGVRCVGGPGAVPLPGTRTIATRVPSVTAPLPPGAVPPGPPPGQPGAPSPERPFSPTPPMLPSGGGGGGGGGGDLFPPEAAFAPEPEVLEEELIPEEEELLPEEEEDQFETAGWLGRP